MSAHFILCVANQASAAFYSQGLWLKPRDGHVLAFARSAP